MDDNTLLLFEDISEAETEEDSSVYEYNESDENNTETETETEIEADSENSYAPEYSSGEYLNEELTDRLDALIDILTPEESTGSESIDSIGSGGNDNTEPVISAEDAYTQELLENINGTLVAIKWDNISYNSEMLAYHEQIASDQAHMVELFECSFLVIFFIGFFLCLLVGNRFANTFFNRMRG